MAWYNDGEWSGLRIDTWHNCLYQLCYATNEREQAAGLTLTEWTTANGSKKITDTDWTPADFEGMLIPGSGVYSNITKLRSAITDLCESGFFVKYPSGDIIDSLSDVLPSGFDTSDERPANYTVWYQIRYALEQLRYVKLSNLILNLNSSPPSLSSPYEGELTSSRINWVNDKSSAANAFQTLLQGGDNYGSWLSYFVSINVYEDPNNTGYYDGDYTSQAILYITSIPDYEIVKCKLYYTVSGDFATTDAVFSCAGLTDTMLASSVGNDVLEITLTDLLTSIWIMIYDVYYENAEGYIYITMGKSTQNPYERLLADNIIGRLKVTYG